MNFTHNPKEAIEGILWSSSWGGWLTLRDVSALTPKQEPTPMPGDVVIHRDRIAFLQVLP